MSLPDRTTAERRPLFGHYCLSDTPEARVRLAATTTMASTLAHELCQPLTAATNYMHACAGRLRRKGEGFEDVLAMIEDASRETLRAAEIIRRMRAFIVTGKIAGRRENLRTMVEAVAAQLEGPDWDEVEIVRDVPLSLFVVADRIQIEQVLANILVNAGEALAGRALRRITIGAAREGGEIVLTIADTGPGFPADVLPRLFEYGFSTRKDGLGVGLPICRTIVEGHGGRIWAENEAGGGAAFGIALPAAREP
jgi:C4-dicarboxylate-specific signal transduction histidine kinase